MNPPLRPTDQDALLAGDSPLITPISHHRSGERPLRVLHVDDDPGLVDLSAEFLEQADGDLSVVTETSAQDGLDRLRNEPIDSVISDYEMPEIDGLEFLDRVRDIDPNLPFILFTGKGSEEVASEAIARGVTDYLQKEVGSEQYEVLANRTRNAIDQYQTHEELFTTLSWYQRLVEQSLAGTYVVQDEELVYVNEKFADIFGYSQEELVGKSAVSLVHDRDEETVLENLRKRHRGEVESIQYTWTGVTKEGNEIIIEAHGGVIELEGTPAVLGILLDSTMTDS